MATVVKPRIYRQCGVIFDGGPRAWYCPACHLARSKEADAGKGRKGQKVDHPLGSIGKCTVCGEEYVVKSGRQKYCPGCAHRTIRAVDRLASRAWNRANKETYCPARNEKRRKERAESPELVRAKEGTACAKQKSKE